MKPKFIKSKSSQEKIFIDLDPVMLPFDGLFNLMEDGFELFFFSKNSSLLDLRVEAFLSYLESRLSEKKTFEFWKNRISCSSKKIPSSSLIVKRKNKFLLEILQGKKKLNICLFPRGELRSRGSLRGEFTFEGVESPFLVSVAQVFFDSLLSPDDRKYEAFFPSLVLCKLLLLEISDISKIYGKSFEAVLGTLQARGFFSSFSSKTSQLVHGYISSSELDSWLLEHFHISSKTKINFCMSSGFSEELLVFRIRVFLLLLSVLFLKKKYFSSFKESEFYISKVLFVEGQQGCLSDFLDEIGYEKFQYLVWEFFPNYSSGLNYKEEENEPLSRKISQSDFEQKDKPMPRC